MSFSFQQNPSVQAHFAYRPVVWEVRSSDVTCVRAICDVIIDGTYEVTLEKSPDLGSTVDFTFDVASVLQDYLEAHLPVYTANQNTCYTDGATALRYELRFFEVLDNGTTFDTSWAENGAGGSYLSSDTVYNLAYSFNGTLRHEETETLTDYQTGGTYAGQHRINKITTTYDSKSTPKPRKMKRGDYACLTGWSLETGLTIRGNLYGYDASGSSTETDVTSGVNSSNMLYQYVYDTGQLLSTTKNVLMNIQKSDNSLVTDYVHFELVDDCNDYVSIYWQNDLGGMDYYLFREKNVKMYEGESNTYTKPLRTSYNTYDHSEEVYGKNSNRLMSCTSEVLDRNQADALSSLITHGVRAWVLENDNFIPIIIKDGSITTLDTLDGEYRLNIEFHHSNKLKTQKY